MRRKGGTVDVIVWQTGTARLLPRLIKSRKSGLLFLTDRRARVELPPCDIDPRQRPGEGVLPPGRGPVQGSVGRSDLASAPARRAHSRG